ncbi:MAG: hypothetical protein J0L87_11815 [Bacteroidetes bacterium]|nr:hypothetical protein [Bacteroidota bacterium]
MSDLTATIAEFKTKIEKLVTLHSQLKGDYDKLVLDNQNLTKTIEEQKLTIENLQKNNQEIINNNNLQQDKIVTDTKLKINELVQEIDNCIALLNK